MKTTMKYKYLNTPWEVVEIPNRGVMIIDCKSNSVTFWNKHIYGKAFKNSTYCANKGLAISDGSFIFEAYRYPVPMTDIEIYDDFDFLKELNKL